MLENDTLDKAEKAWYDPLPLLRLIIALAHSDNMRSGYLKLNHISKEWISLDNQKSVDKINCESMKCRFNKSRDVEPDASISSRICLAQHIARGISFLWWPQSMRLAGTEIPLLSVILVMYSSGQCITI